jgi:TonB family protein
MMPYSVSRVFATAALLCAAAGRAGADDEQPALRTYVEARPLTRAPPSYPQGALMRRDEGWVMVSFIVSKDGTVTEPMIEDSSNHAFDGPALDAVQSWTYEPAKLNDEPVEQSMVKTIIRFQMSDVQRGASQPFVRDYRAAQSALFARDFAKSGALLAELEGKERHNLYEESWLFWLKAAYLIVTGSEDEAAKTDALQKALAGEPTYLAPDMYVFAARELFDLLVRKGEVGAAIDVYDGLAKSAVAKRSKQAQPALAALRPAYQALQNGVTGGNTLTLHATIGANAYWVHDLLRRSFSMDHVEGRVEQIDIRCERGTTRYAAVTDGTIWRVPDDWGKCGAYIKGEEGTTFLFYERPLTDVALTLERGSPRPAPAR